MHIISSIGLPLRPTTFCTTLLSHLKCKIIGISEYDRNCCTVCTTISMICNLIVNNSNLNSNNSSNDRLPTGSQNSDNIDANDPMAALMAPPSYRMNNRKSVTSRYASIGFAISEDNKSVDSGSNSMENYGPPSIGNGDTPPTVMSFGKK